MTNVNNTVYMADTDNGRVNNDHLGITEMADTDNGRENNIHPGITGMADTDNGRENNDHPGIKGMADTDNERENNDNPGITGMADTDNGRVNNEQPDIVGIAVNNVDNVFTTTSGQIIIRVNEVDTEVRPVAANSRPVRGQLNVTNDDCHASNLTGSIIVPRDDMREPIIDPRPTNQIPDRTKSNRLSVPESAKIYPTPPHPSQEMNDNFAMLFEPPEYFVSMRGRSGCIVYLTCLYS